MKKQLYSQRNKKEGHAEALAIALAIASSMLCRSLVGFRTTPFAYGFLRRLTRSGNHFNVVAAVAVAAAAAGGGCFETEEAGEAEKMRDDLIINPVIPIHS